MAAVPPGRWTVDIEGDFVVFLIGATVRNPFRAVRALPLLMQMPRMLAGLAADPDRGLLGFQRHGGLTGVIVQYWRSFEHLERFARDPGARHARVWREWFRLGQHRNGAVGIWHETFQVRAGQYEAVYQGMADFGLMRAGRAHPVGARDGSAAARIGAQESSVPRPGEPAGAPPDVSGAQAEPAARSEPPAATSFTASGDGTT